MKLLHDINTDSFTGADTSKVHMIIDDNESIPSGYSELTTNKIVLLDKHCEQFIGAKNWFSDYISFKKYLKELRDAKGGYSSCTAEEKKILLRHMSSGNGSEYNDTAIIDPDSATALDIQKRWHKEHNIKSFAAASYRDTQGSVYIESLIYTGQILESNGRALSNGSKDMVYGWIKHGNTELFDYIKNEGNYTPYDIIAVDSTNKQITISGDHEDDFIKILKNGRVKVKKKKVQWKGSATKDGEYTVTDAELSGSDTVITFSETIADNTVDGDLYTSGLLGWSFITTAMKTKIVDIYVNGIF